MIDVEATGFCRCTHRPTWNDAVVDSDAWERITRREPIVSGGKSGSQLERGWLDDGSPVVIKHAVADADWIMQATDDRGRVADMWVNGVFDRVPTVVEHALLAVRRKPGGAELLMSDLSGCLFSSGPDFRACHLDVLSGVTSLHRAFASGPVNELCSLRDYYTFLSPQVCARFSHDHDVPALAVEGWARFHELVPDDVVGAIDRLHDDPRPLVDALSGYEGTLVHGDLKMANLGMDRGRVVLLDWGTLTTWAPAAVDFAWYLAINAAALDLDLELDVLVEQCRRAIGAGGDAALDLALVGALAQLGWEKALGASAGHAATMQRERVGLAWWVRLVREALAKWPL
jgi:hypothetical protein